MFGALVWEDIVTILHRGPEGAQAQDSGLMRSKGVGAVQSQRTTFMGKMERVSTVHLVCGGRSAQRSSHSEHGGKTTLSGTSVHAGLLVSDPERFFWSRRLVFKTFMKTNFSFFYGKKKKNSVRRLSAERLC